MKVKATIKLNNKKYSILILVVVLVLLKSNAQTQRIKLEGTVNYDSMYLPDINILNNLTLLGTASNTKGKFTIYVKEADSIIFSSLVYTNRSIKISETHIKSKSITVYLEPDYYQLEEIMLNNQIVIDWAKSSVTKGTILNNDVIINNKAPNARKLTDPNANAGGLNPIALFMSLTKKARIKRKKRRDKEEKLQQQKNEFPETIRRLYNDKFYIEWLHIPEEKINLFLDFCEGNGLLELYDNDEIIIKDFLIKQAKKFNSINN